MPLGFLPEVYRSGIQVPARTLYDPSVTVTGGFLIGQLEKFDRHACGLQYLL